jgi:hypothetical protein
MAIETKRTAGYMSGKGYGKGFDVPGTGAAMLVVAAQARAKHYQAAGAPPGRERDLGRFIAACAMMQHAREGYDQFRRDMKQAWLPYVVPAAERVKIDMARGRAQRAVAKHMAEGRSALEAWAQAARKAAYAHRPAVTADARRQAQEKIAQFRPADWPAGEVVGRRLQLARAALAARDLVLADEVLLGTSLDVVMQAAHIPLDPFARPDARGAAHDDAVWKAEQMTLLRELCGEGAHASLEAWREIDEDARSLGGLLDHEGGRMLHAEDWGDADIAGAIPAPALPEE